MWQLVVAGELGIQSPSPDVSSVTSLVHEYVSGWSGVASAEPDGSGLWTEDEHDLHVNVLEMKTVQLALVTFWDRFIEEPMVLMSGSAMVVAYIK